MAIEQSNRAYREIGIADSHHGLTHHGGDKEKIEKCIKINRFQIEQFGYFIDKLKATKDGDGTLFDHIMVSYGSGLSRDHDHDDLPTVITGRGNGLFHLGRHVTYPKETPLANLHVAMMNQMGIPAETFADSTGQAWLPLGSLDRTIRFSATASPCCIHSMDTAWSAPPWISFSRWRRRGLTRQNFARRSSSASAKHPSRAARRSTPTVLISSGPSKPPRSRRSSSTTSQLAPCAASRGTNLWFHTAQLRVGTSHRFHYLIDGKKFGGSYDVPAYGPLSYARPGVPQGRVSEKLVHTSKLYGGMETNYWIYVPAQYDPAVPAALMVWQDGERYMSRNVEEICRLCPSLYRLQEVTDNLIHDKKIPVMIHVFVSPGTLNGKPLRSILYDTVSDKYGQFLLEELLPEVYAKYNIRKDAYSRAIQGQSSGGIAAFTVAYNRPESFSRVYTVVGSFTALQWKPGELDGGNIYPFKVRREPKRNLRVWMNDGSEDQEANSGSWPLQNIQLANSLKLKGLRFSFQLRRRLASRRARRIGAAGVPDVAVAGLRSREDRTDLRAERRREVEAAVPRADLQPLSRDNSRQSFVYDPVFWIEFHREKSCRAS